jgi:hypothetical protein
MRKLLARAAVRMPPTGNAGGIGEWLFLQDGEHDPESLQWEANVNGLDKS